MTIQKMNFERQQISLTSYEEGSLVPRKGIFNDTVIEKGRVKDTKVFKTALIPSTVTRITRLNEDAVDFYATNRPRHINSFIWKKMKYKKRIRENLKLLVGHNDFKFEFI
jgi:hypothetical protein